MKRVPVFLLISVGCVLLMGLGAIANMIAPIPEWLIGFILSLTAVALVALWACFFVSRKLEHHSWSLSAAFVFIIGAVTGPTSMLLLVNFLNIGFSLPGFVTTILSSVAFLSMFISLIVAGILFLVGQQRALHQ